MDVLAWWFLVLNIEHADLATRRPAEENENERQAASQGGGAGSQDADGGWCDTKTKLKTEKLMCRYYIT